MRNIEVEGSEFGKISNLWKFQQAHLSSAIFWQISINLGLDIKADWSRKQEKVGSRLVLQRVNGSSIQSYKVHNPVNWIAVTIQSGFLSYQVDNSFWKPGKCSFDPVRWKTWHDSGPCRIGLMTIHQLHKPDTFLFRYSSNKRPCLMVLRSLWPTGQNLIRTSLSGPLVQRAVQVTHGTLLPLEKKHNYSQTMTSVWGLWRSNQEPSSSCYYELLL